MSWNKFIIIITFFLLAGCNSTVKEICPLRQDAHLHNIDVFDGNPKELVKLKPDTEEIESGYWTLGYVYDAGRQVTIRCDYTDGYRIDIPLPNRVNKCYYKLDPNKTYTISCH